MTVQEICFYTGTDDEKDEKGGQSNDESTNITYFCGYFGSCLSGHIGPGRLETFVLQVVQSLYEPVEINW